MNLLPARPCKPETPNQLTTPPASPPPSERSQTPFSIPDPLSAPAPRSVTRPPRTPPDPLPSLELSGFRPRKAKAPPGHPARPSCEPLRPPPTRSGSIWLPFRVENPWFSGAADVATYALDELLSTKLRALYQRKKGRDLF
ncbi:MAG: nucleotidyl transferase AbiEii/AbiGii toxin family protein, partial [Deltaproteobacteria bacterium]|nr:nucleotidyl transferase AbiEii/AbiGii toxin family protein [Deltaproteobacteria bacterium]